MDQSITESTLMIMKKRHTNKKGLKEFAELLKDLRTVRGIKYITVSKNWIDEPNEKEIKVHIDDINILDFFANMEERT